MLPRALWHIGGLTIYTFGVFLGLGLLIGLVVAHREAVRKKLDEDAFMWAVTAALAGGLIGARLLYAVLHLGDYLSSPVELIHVEQGGFALFGGLGLGAVAAYLAARRLRLPFAPALDAAAPGIALAYAVGRVGCDIYGKVANVPWAVWVDGVPHHPSQLYSVIVGLAIFAFLWSRRRRVTFSGELFTWYAGLYAIGRFLVEFTRYPDTMVGPVTLTQAVTIPVALVAFGLLIRRGAVSLPRRGAAMAGAGDRPGPRD